MLADVLDLFGSTDETFFERFSHEKGRRRRYIARNKADLYPGRLDLAEEFSKPLSGGWWMGTNYSYRAIMRILEVACRVAGVRFGIDLRIGEQHRPMDITKAMAFVGIAADPDPRASLKTAELFAEAVERDKPSPRPR
jgi:hypothetical protein